VSFVENLPFLSEKKQFSLSPSFVTHDDAGLNRRRSAFRGDDSHNDVLAQIITAATVE